MSNNDIKEVRMNLTHLEYMWLRSRGGRMESDVLFDDHIGKYVLMSDGNGGLYKKAIPSEKELQDMFN